MSRSLALSFLLPLAACMTEKSVDEHVFEEPVASVRIDAGAADVDIVAVEGLAGARVVSRTEWQEQPPTVRVDVVDGELRIVSACEIQLTVGTSCAVDLSLEVPAAADVRSDLGSGNVSIEGLHGAIELATDSGDVALRAVAGTVAVDTGSGNVTGRDLDLETLSAMVGSGDIDVELATAPASAWLETSSGNIDLSVPGGAYNLSTSTSSGEIAVEGVEHDASAASRLDLHTGSGDIALVGR